MVSTVAEHTALVLDRAMTLARRLQTALARRAVIDQAIGIVISNRRCSADEAFTYLRTASQNRNMKLRDIATELVQTMTRPRVTAGRARSSPPTGA